MRVVPILSILPVCLCAGLALGATPDPDLHRPSPDWRDQIIYFAMIDRFDDGDPGNNDQGAGVYDPGDARRYSGGDLAGLTRRVDYLHALGATALWITPPVANQWWDARAQFSGYHGYWAENFVAVDAHYGSLDDYRALSRALHRNGMYLVQDIVVNHVGNFFSYPDGFDPADPTRGFVPNADARPRARPSQPPFHLNDARDPAQRAAGIYHWTPTIRNFDDPVQELTWALADLDDLATEHPGVQAALRQSYGHWIREVGVDAFRVDTAFYVEPGFFRDFLHADTPGAPGILRVAQQTGRDHFHVFGEGFAVDAPYADDKARRIERWARDQRGDLLPGMINFPLYGSLLDVFARGRPAAVLGHRITSMMQVHARPHLMPTFVDNHDVDRFLAGGGRAGLRQALLAILTLPGIPVIYYGTEQGFTEARAAMFARGHRSGGRDHFDPGAPLYRWLQRAIALRRSEPALRRGTPRVLGANAADAGAVLWLMQHEDDTLLIALNSADVPTLAARVDTGLLPHARLTPLFAIVDEAPAAQLDARAQLSLALPARSGYVWRVEAPLAQARPADRDVVLDDPGPGPFDASLKVSGRASAHAALQLVLDGDLAHAATTTADADGRWQARVDLSRLVDEQAEHEVVVWDAARGIASAARRFRIARRWQTLADVDDPAGDDRGPQGRYRYPTEPAFARHRTLDLRRIVASASGGSLRLELTLADLIAAWSPPNGFDHLALTVFLELPGRADGTRVMPLQHALLPDDMRWHYRLRLGGWANTLFSSDGASASHEGRSLSPAPTLQVDRERDRVTLWLPARALGDPASLRGARLYVTTWDYDAGYRALEAEPRDFVFGGGAPELPRVMDDSGVLRLQ